MLRSFFHAWERRLASATTDRVQRPFEWGVDWIPSNGNHNALAVPRACPSPALDRHAPTEPDRCAHPMPILTQWVDRVMTDTDRFFTPPPVPADAYRLQAMREGQWRLSFSSAFETPHAVNNRVACGFFPARDRRAAVVVLPQWNADAQSHVALCRWLARDGVSALRLSLPYHDDRMPPELHRADYIVSSNVARTVQVCRQAVLDARRAIGWLASEGYERIGILGTSLGSCLALLTAAHEPLVRAQALNHISPYFADVVWRGLSTEHVRAGLDGHIDLDLLRRLWRPISPHSYLERIRDRSTLLVYARYDLTFPVDLSVDLVRDFEARAIPHEVAVLPCGHYSSGRAPFNVVDAWLLTRFLRRALRS
jgi:hypothetical protein